MRQSPPKSTRRNFLQTAAAATVLGAGTLPVGAADLKEINFSRQPGV